VRRLLIALAAGALSAHAALAQLPTSDKSKPVAIEADNGIEWQQNNQVYIARGHAKATRGVDTVTADTLSAYYRPTGAAPQPAAKRGDQDPLGGGGGSQVYRIDADGHVVFATPTETMYGEHGVYDVDKAVLVVTGKGLKIVTPRDTVTARDQIEWHDQQQIGVARGNAVAVRADRRVRADVLTARVVKDATGASRVSRIDAHGNVIVSSPGQVGRGDQGVYNLDTGIATLSGHVRLTRGDDVLRGRYAVVDLKTNVSRILDAPPGTQLAGGGGRVQGLIVPHATAAAR
jgi:lipopolysaccharide export system protein LptA